MCVEEDQIENGKEDSKSNDLLKSLPEPGKPTEIPSTALIPPNHQSTSYVSEPTIAKAEVFGDIDLSSISETN